MKTSYIDPETVAAIHSHMGEERWLALWVASETGLRVGDVVAIRLEDVKRSRLTYIAKKTGKQGSCSLPSSLSRAIEVKKSDLQGRSPWLFPSPRDPRKHITRQAVWHRVKRACQKAGIDPQGIAPHSFRKYFAVELFKREGMAVTQKALQHDRASTTELYALSDFTSGANAALPLQRRDLPMIVEMVLQALKGRAAPSKNPC